MLVQREHGQDDARPAAAEIRAAHHAVTVFDRDDIEQLQVHTLELIDPT
ncbi:hypothetical protein ATK17_1571 [Branchiibius hedensis]|uniref:Uncharacterized protein n=1 Tax=Branchiibius hedensis TaxID=672460 RepID=A0A2Y9BTM7_9MICO|nr:hypothetical protein ATK17_1571 [Branchiibius hedensis]SSA34262.1 hypothetical protein SAMN04489750_1571 [Branchiibius hedensis]